MARKKKRLPGPRLHRLKRSARLNSARAWLPKYEGKRIVRSYRKRYGVDLLCAIAELQMLKVPLDPTYIDRVRTTVDNAIRRRAVHKKTSTTVDFSEVDSTFAYIAGPERIAASGTASVDWPRAEYDFLDDELPF